jgi:hypothetical protein
MIFLQGFIKFDQGISEKCVGETFGRRKKERKKKNNNKKRSKHNSLGDIMTLISGSQYFICFFHPFPMNISLELKMAAVAMETAKMLKKNKKKHKNDHSRLLAKQKLMKLDRNNIHV